VRAGDVVVDTGVWCWTCLNRAAVASGVRSAESLAKEALSAWWFRSGQQLVSENRGERFLPHETAWPKEAGDRRRQFPSPPDGKAHVGVAEVFHSWSRYCVRGHVPSLEIAWSFQMTVTESKTSRADPKGP